MLIPRLGLPLFHRPISQTLRSPTHCGRKAFNILNASKFHGQTRSLEQLTFPLPQTFFITRQIPKLITPERFSLSGFLQFARTRIRNATHRDGLLNRSPLRQPRPPNRKSPFQWLDSIKPQTIFWGIIALNVGVFLAWQAAINTWQVSKDPTLLLLMRKNFLVNYQNVSSGRIWTLITSCFSHQEVSHALFNGLTFFFMGPAVMGVLGNRRFLGLYLLGGLCCSLASLTWNRLYKNEVISSLGASGSIMAMIAFYACMFPRNKFYIFLVIPCPAWAFLPGVLLFDVFRTVTDVKTKTDTAGHVGGLLTGIAYYLSRVALRR
ncbi:hypothetical protein BJ138DRAFT_994952 [Hygrophoropsis aurantiaca]|uniref:Uncharacterized protein n=1 Tax=Hygrophoropsis aurantiaca TaxID=72124 RepID=A0ACB8AVD5_9AGAM|nr:hypothetical protein BJ138DRAFT_994952 [Hygrophoropsis aurantiaca]